MSELATIQTSRENSFKSPHFVDKLSGLQVLMRKVDTSLLQRALIPLINRGRMIFGPEYIPPCTLVVKVQFALIKCLRDRLPRMKQTPILNAVHDCRQPYLILNAAESAASVVEL